jgi:8-oxo-dGTP pyrophosphatase MutT (NUDIX family)
MDKIGFRNCQWVLVRHTDTETEDGLPRPHFHIVANRVQLPDYKVVTAWRDYRRSEVAIRELEEEFGLIQVQPSWEFDRIAPSTGNNRKQKGTDY